MLDIKFIRENKDLIAMGARKKRMSIDLDRLLAVDDERKALMSSLDAKRAQQGQFGLQIQNETDATVKQSLIEQMQVVKKDMQVEEESLKPLLEEWRALMLTVPNIPDMTVPEGESDADNAEIRTWGEKPKFSFDAKDHVELMTALGMVDFERGTKVAGFRGYFLKADGARLTWALWQYAQQFFLAKGFNPIIAPSLVRKEVFYGSGYLPQGEEDLYRTQDNDYLAGTAEVATMGYYMDEVIPKEELPIKFLGFSPCYRREAGAHGKDTKGLIRVHEFYKWEQVILCSASHQESVQWHDWLNRNTEEFIESLNIPYHTVVNCGGDLGQGQVKKYDIELWVPKENTYREIASTSYFHDFQTRRLNIRYRDDEGKLRFAHSLNSTAVPTPRILVSLVENFQQADGSIKIPDVLVPFMGMHEIRRA
jgi:seryl-tRNA synthetase